MRNFGKSLLKYTWKSLWIFLPGLLLFVFWFPTYWYPFGRDQGVFSVVALDILDGKIPYRDVLDLKPPGIFYLYSMAFAVFGNSMKSIRIMDFLLVWTQLSSALFLFPRNRRLFIGIVASTALGIGYFHLLIYWWMAIPDYYLLIPILWGLIIYQRLSRNISYRRLSFFCGIMLGICFWLKFTGIIIGMVFLYIFLKKHHVVLREKFAFVSHQIIFCGLGFCLFSIAVTFYYYFHGALWDMFETLFILVPKYAAFINNPREGDRFFLHFNITNILQSTFNFMRMMPNLIFPTIITTVFFIKRKKHPYGLYFVMLIACYLSVVVQNKMLISHLTILILPLSILTAGAFEFCIAPLKIRAGSRKWKYISLFTGIFCALIVVFGTYFSNVAGHRRALLRTWRKQLNGNERAQIDFYSWFGGPGRGDFSFLANHSVAIYLQKMSRKTDKIFIWGFEPIIYALSGRPHATRFLMNYFIISNEAPSKWKREFFADLESDPPEIFIVVNNDQMPYLTGFTMDSKQLLETKFRNLKRWLDKNYILEKKIEHFEIYRYNKS